MASGPRRTSGPKPPLPKPKPAADPGAEARLAAALAELIGPDWHEARYGIAVSGGSDSMALLALMHRLLPGRVEAATVDHGLRAASADEAKMVGEWCAGEGVPWQCLVPEQPIKGSLQAEARSVRYALLGDWRVARGLDYLVTAHHADDQLETLVMRLNRASGVGGLAAIRARQGHILRPVLQWRRAELLRWADAHGVPHVTDPSNADPRFDRARLRLALARQDWLDPLAVTRSAAWLDQADQALEWTARRLISAWPDAADPAVIRNDGYPDELLRRILLIRLQGFAPALAVRGVALDGVMQAMRSGQRVMVGNLLIDPATDALGSVWRISKAPRRKALPK